MWVPRHRWEPGVWSSVSDGFIARTITPMSVRSDASAAMLRAIRAAQVTPGCHHSVLVMRRIGARSPVGRMTMVEPLHIPLNHGKEALIDAEDAPRIGPYRWHAQEVDGRWGAARGIRLGPRGSRKVRLIWMHRAILDAAPGTLVIHRNGDGLDNRRANLQIVTAQGRSATRRRNRNNTSGFRGVTFDRNSGRWRATLGYFGRKVSLGYYGTPEEAARAYDAKAGEVFGEIANLNFGAADDDRRE